MKGRQLNFVTDSLAFVTFLFLTSTGVMLRYQLPPGSGGHEGRGLGPGQAQQTVLTLWGWSRHDWGAIHYWVACVLMGVLAIHLFLHWNWIVHVIGGKSTDLSGLRLALGAVGLCALAFLTAIPWMTPTAATTRAEFLKATSPETPDTPLASQLRGSMRLESVSESIEIPVGELVQRLGLPDDVSPAARVGQLLRDQGKHMDDLRRLVNEFVSDSGSAKQESEKSP